MDSQAAFKVLFIIIILSLVVQGNFFTGVAGSAPPESFDLTLRSVDQTENAHGNLEKNIGVQADEDFINDLINSGVSNGLIDQVKYEVAPAPSGAPSFDDLQFNRVQNAPAVYPRGLPNSVSGGKYPISNYDLSKPAKDCKVNKMSYQSHADSDFSLAQVINNQINGENQPVQPDNSCGETYVSAHFGDTSITPFNRSYGLATNEFYLKNKVSHFNSIESGLAEFPSAAVLSGEFTPGSASNKTASIGHAAVRNSGQPAVQIDSKIYGGNSQYACGGVMGDLMAANASDNFASV